MQNTPRARSLSNIKLIAISGAMTEGQGQGLLEDGFSAFIRKPFEIRQLTESMSEIKE